MEPLRKEHVDLVDMLLERGVAGGVVGNVVGGPQTFAVEWNFGRPKRAGATGWAGSAFAVKQRGEVGDGLVIVLGCLQEKFRQPLAAKGIENEPRHHQRRQDGYGVENPA